MDAGGSADGGRTVSVTAPSVHQTILLERLVFLTLALWLFVLLGDTLSDAQGEVGVLLAFGGDADFSAGEELDALGFEGVVVNAVVEPDMGEVLVGGVGPLGAPGQQFRAGVSIALLCAKIF